MAQPPAPPSRRRPSRLAGAATREALQRSAEAQGQLASSVMGRLQDLGTALRRDVNGGAPPLTPKVCLACLASPASLLLQPLSSLPPACVPFSFATPATVGCPNGSGDSLVGGFRL